MRTHFVRFLYDANHPTIYTCDWSVVNHRITRRTNIGQKTILRKEVPIKYYPQTVLLNNITGILASMLCSCCSKFDGTPIASGWIYSPDCISNLTSPNTNTRKHTCNTSSSGKYWLQRVELSASLNYSLLQNQFMKCNSIRPGHYYSLTPEKLCHLTD